MAQPAIQHSFHAGEWAPALNARVDLAKYHSAAALVKNFFVDYRGGVSSCPGTKYILQAFDSTADVRLIKFQASSSVGYILEFGDLYIRFINDGAYVLESTIAITGASQANPCVLQVANTYAVGDWIYITGVVGMTQLNGRYFRVNNVTGATITLGDLNGVNINSTAYTAWSSGGTVARVYKITSPFAAADLALVKFTQNVNYMVLCHPSYTTQILTLTSAANWNISPILIGTTITAPTIAAANITGGAGATNYAYVATAVDVYGQESVPSAIFNKAGADITLAAGSIAIALTATVSGALYYFFYKTQQNYAGAVPAGPAFGFIGYSTTVNFIDDNIGPDFSQPPPIFANPFLPGSSVASVTVTNKGAYAGANPFPTITLDAPASGATATVSGVWEYTPGGFALSLTGAGYAIGNAITFTNGVTAVVTNVGGGGAITGITFTGNGTTFTTYPGATLVQISVVPAGGSGASITYGYRLNSLILTYAGFGYTSTPAVTFTPATGGIAATAVLSAAGSPPGNPSVPVFYQQRLVLAAPTGAPQSFYGSQPGFPFNFNISNPIQPDDSFTETLVSGTLNTIKAMVPMSNGLVMLGDNSAWLVNGGSAGAPLSTIDISAQTQAYNGASDVPPIPVNYDILYVQQKGSIVRDLTFNFYLSNYTGTDITILSSHLFYGHTIVEWAYAEEPFKVVWAVRNDGDLLSLTFIKEQEIVGWAHRDTDGLFKSVASVIESVTLSNGVTVNVDAVYVVVERTINGNTVKYIERFAERIFPSGTTDCWFVDAGIRYDGSPTTSFVGAEHLAGATVVGLADGVPITPFVMPTNGFFTMSSAVSKLTIGLAYTPQLQTLRLDLGEPTVQGKRKKIAAVTARVQETLGLSIGKTFDTLVPMKDLVIGNVGSASNTVVSGLVTDDARTILDPSWTVDGQYCFQQDHPLPATILGVIPEIVVGDTK